MLEEHLCINGSREEWQFNENDENRPYLHFIDFAKLKVITTRSFINLLRMLWIKLKSQN